MMPLREAAMAGNIDVMDSSDIRNVSLKVDGLLMSCPTLTFTKYALCCMSPKAYLK